MASIWPSVRCSSPQATTCSTASNTLSQEVRKHSAVSFHERRREQRARKSIYALVQGAFPVAPGDFLDGHHAAPAAIDATHGVQQEDEESPERNELKTSFLELVVTVCPHMAARADCGRIFARSHNYFDAL